MKAETHKHRADPPPCVTSCDQYLLQVQHWVPVIQWPIIMSLPHTHTHIHTYNGAASGHQISGDWPLLHPGATSLPLTANQNPGWAESETWNRGLDSTLQTSGLSWRPTETRVSCFYPQTFLLPFGLFFVALQSSRWTFTLDLTNVVTSSREVSV